MFTTIFLPPLLSSKPPFARRERSCHSLQSALAISRWPASSSLSLSQNSFASSGRGNSALPLVYSSYRLMLDHSTLLSADLEEASALASGYHVGRSRWLSLITTRTGLVFGTPRNALTKADLPLFGWPCRPARW